jgi:hypothetical protein
MELKEGWAARQVVSTNAFAQAEMKEEVYVDPQNYLLLEIELTEFSDFSSPFMGLNMPPRYSMRNSAQV